MAKITRHTELDVYRKAFEASMELFERSKGFPKEELYSLTDQMRRASRSVCANLGEAWRKRRYPAAFVSKLSDSDGEAGEVQVWIEYAVRCGYLDRDCGAKLFAAYDEIERMLVSMIAKPGCWLLKDKETE